MTGTCTGTSKPLLYFFSHVSPKSLTCLVCFLQNAIDKSCVDESQDECEERDSIQEAHEIKKACDRKRNKADFGSNKDSTKAQYWLDPERKKDSVKAYYDQNRELHDFSLQTSLISGKSKGKEILRGRSIPFGCNRPMSKFIHAQGNGISFACVFASQCYLHPPPPPPPPLHVSSVRYASWPMACW